MALLEATIAAETAGTAIAGFLDDSKLAKFLAGAANITLLKVDALLGVKAPPAPPSPPSPPSTVTVTATATVSVTATATAGTWGSPPRSCSLLYCVHGSKLAMRFVHVWQRCLAICIS